MMMNFKIYHIFCLVALFLLSLEPCLDVSADSLSPEEIYKKSQGIAKGSTPKLEELGKGGAGIDKIHEILQNKEGAAPHQTVDLGTLPSIGEKAKENKQGAEKTECTKEDCNVSNVMSGDAYQAKEERLEAYGFKKDNDQFPKDNKGYIDKARLNTKKYESNFNAIVGSYKDCKAKTMSSSFKENLECDEYYDVKYSNCPITQIVEIDPKYTYQCSKKREESIKTCHEEITSITCQKSPDCDNGGIVAASVESDMKFEYAYPYLTIGTIADNYWEGNCTVFDRTTKFEIRGLDKIAEFRITQVGFDDYLWIKVNNKTVYVGPDGGDSIELNTMKYLELIARLSPDFHRVLPSWFETKVTNGHLENACERNKSWEFSDEIDLKPYLEEGENKIWMRVIVSGKGEGWMTIKAKQHCCRDEDWVIKRETTCTHKGL